MKSIVRLITLLLLIGGWGLAALALHVVRTPDEVPITLVPKDRLGLIDTYVDTTKWTLDDAANHPAVVEKLVQCGHADALRHVVDPKGGDVAEQLTNAISHASKKETRRSSPATAASQVARGFLGF